MIPLQVRLGALNGGHIQTFSISRATNQIRNANETAFKPKVICIEKAWSISHQWKKSNGITRTTFSTKKESKRKTEILQERLHNCGDILNLHNKILASYGGKNQIEPQELTEIMIIDGCFLLELFVRVSDLIQNINYHNEVVLNDKKMMSIMNDIIKLENQISHIVLKELYRKVFTNGSDIENDHRVTNIVCKAFGYPESQEERKRIRKELLRCVARLRAPKITIKAANSTAAQHNLVNWFDFEISFDCGVLQILPLVVKETTEVRTEVEAEDIRSIGLNLKKLKEVKVSGTKILKELPDLSKATNLEVLESCGNSWKNLCPHFSPTTCKFETQNGRDRLRRRDEGKIQEMEIYSALANAEQCISSSVAVKLREMHNRQQ
ncbi:hypothetical protein CR513_60007, partial [Mucuna pruriens]